MTIRLPAESSMICDARLHHPPPAAGHRRHAHGGADRVHAVPLRRRSDQPDGRHRDHRRGARAAAPAARPQRSGARPVRPLRRQRGAAQFRQLLSVQDAGDRPDRRPFPGHDGACLRLRAVLAADRHSDGRLHGAAPALVALQHLPRGIADRHFAADLPDRHPADLPVPGDARRAALVRARRGRAARLLDHRACSPHPA